MIKELKYDGCKFGDEIRLPKTYIKKEYSDAIATTPEELASYFDIYTDEFFNSLKERSIVFNKFSKDRKTLKQQVEKITSKNKNYILVTSKYDDYIFWGIKGIDK